MTGKVEREGGEREIEVTIGKAEREGGKGEIEVT